MATRKCWSRRVGTRRGNRVRIYEREPGGILYAAVWNGERGTYSQRSLGHKDRDRATREAAELVRLRDAGEWNDSRSFTLGMLVERFLVEATHTRDGSLKTPRYMLGCKRVELMTNNPAKLDGLADAGIEIIGRMPIEAPVNADNARYLTAKAVRAGHKLHHLIGSMAEPSNGQARVAELVR